MLESTKKKIKITKTIALAHIGILLISLVAFLICQFAVGDKLGFPPIWMLFIVLGFGEFLFGFVGGLITKSPLSIILGGISGVIGLEILLFCAANIKYWYVWIIIGLVMLIAIFCLTFFIKSDALVVEFDNQPDSGRKTYKERLAEREEQKKNQEEKPLPEIKSFKD